MNKKKNRVAIVIMIALVFGFILCIQLIPDEYMSAKRSRVDVYDALKPLK